MSGFHLVDRRRLGIQIDRSGRGCSPLGYSQEQTQNELREVEPRLTLLLRQEHYTQNCWQTICISLCMRLTKSTRVNINVYILKLFKNFK